MNPFLYDVRRVLLNRGVLLIIVATTLLSFVGLTIFVALGRPSSPFQVAYDGKVTVLIMGIIFAFFVPVLGIQTGYSTYARDRATGVLESVLVRPISRGRIITARFVAVGIASALGIALALGVLDLLAAAETGYLLPGDQLAALFTSLLVESVAFAGLLFLIAHLLRSPGAIFGSAVVVFVLIDIVWFFLLVFVGVFFGGLSSGGVGHLLTLEYLDPSGFPFLMLTLVQGGIFGGFVPAPPGTLPPWALVASGLGWSVGPFLLALHLARTRD